MQPKNKTSVKFQRPKTRDILIAAAATEFAEHGFRGASLRDIAARVDVTFAAVAYHFGGKENLWLAVVQKALQEIVDINQKFEVDYDDDPMHQIELYFRYLLSHSLDNSERGKLLQQVVVHKNIRKTEDIKPLIFAFRNDSVSKIKSIFEMGLVSKFNVEEIHEILGSFLKRNGDIPVDLLAHGKNEKLESIIDFQCGILMKLIDRNFLNAPT